MVRRNIYLRAYNMAMFHRKDRSQGVFPECIGDTATEQISLRREFIDELKI